MEHPAPDHDAHEKEKTSEERSGDEGRRPTGELRARDSDHYTPVPIAVRHSTDSRFGGLRAVRIISRLRTVDVRCTAARSAVALLTACASSTTVDVTATAVQPAADGQSSTSRSPAPTSAPGTSAASHAALSPSALQANGQIELQVGGVAGVPGDASAVVLNVTATNTSAPGFLTVFPCGQQRPLASNVNYVANQSIPNLVIAKLGVGGKVCIYSMVTTDVVADVAGYFPAGSDYSPIPNPTRILDTR